MDICILITLEKMCLNKNRNPAQRLQHISEITLIRQAQSHHDPLVHHSQEL